MNSDTQLYFHLNGMRDRLTPEGRKKLLELEGKVGDEVPFIQREAPPTPEPTWRDRARAVTDGAFFGFGDNIEAGLRTGAENVADAITGNSAALTYGQNLEDIRADNQVYRENNPWEALGASALGAIPTGMGLAKGLQAIGPASAMASPVARNTIEGLVAGLLGGMGGAEGDTSMLEGGATGGILGGFMGGAAPPLLSAAGKAAGAVMSPITNRMTAPGTHAMRKFDEAMTNQGMSYDDARRRMMEGGNEAMLMDLGPGFESMTYPLAMHPTTGPAVKNAINARHSGMQPRLMQKLDETMGGNQGRFWDLRDEVLNSRRAEANRLYDVAYSNPVPPTQKLRGILKRDAVQKAWERAKYVANTEGEVFPDESLDVMPSMKGWDWIKRGIDGLIDTETDSVTGKVSSMGRSYLKLKNELLDELDFLNDDYKTARDAFAGKSAILKAADKGRKILREDYELAERAVGGMSASEKEAYRVGAAREVIDQIESAKETGSAAVRTQIAAPKYKKRLRQAFPDDATFEDFYGELKLEADRALSRNNITQNSMTEMRKEGKKAFDTRRSQAVDEVQTQGPMHAAWNRLVNTEPSPQEYLEGKNILVSPGYRENMRVLDLIETMTTPSPLQAGIQDGTIPMTGVGIIGNILGQNVNAFPGVSDLFGN